MSITIGIADDHQLFLESLSLLIGTFKDIKVVVQATNGQDLLTQLQTTHLLPDLLLVDVNMPVMNGPVTIDHLKRNFPQIKTAALSMQEDEYALIQMLAAGSRGWWLKDMAADDLEQAIVQIEKEGYYNGDVTYRNWRHSKHPGESSLPIDIDTTDQEILLLRYQAISWEDISKTINMRLSVLQDRRISMYETFHVGSDTGLILEALRHGIVTLQA